MLSVGVPLLIQIALIFTATMGAIQVVALRNELEGLAWWPVRPQRKRPGYALAGLLMAIAFLGGVWPISSRAPLPPPLFAPVFLVGSGLALLVSVVSAAIRLRWRQRRRLSSLQGQPVELGPLRATFYQPEGRGPFPALCLLPDPTAPGDDLTGLVQALIEDEIAVLALEGRLLSNPDRLTLQGLIAVGISHLAQWPEIDAGQVGLVGVGLGGDLALRSAVIDPGVATVLAIEPVLSIPRPGLGLESLRALSWFEARLRAYRWRRSTLVKELDGLAAIPCVAPRPAAVAVGCARGAEGMGKLWILRGENGCPLTPVADPETVNRVTVWLKERLT